MSMNVKTQDLLPGRFVRIDLASGDTEDMLVTAADLVGIWAGSTLIPWQAIDRLEVTR